MRRGLPMIVWAVVWTIVVAIATVSVWSAISRAGAHVTNLAAPKLPTSAAVTPTQKPTAEPTAEATPVPTPPASRATPRPTPRTTPRPTPRETTTDRPEPVTVQGSWTGQAGRVTAKCTAQQIKLEAAVPADGFTVEIEGKGPEALEITFHQTRGESEVKVKGTCGRDGPKFVVEQD